MNIYEHIDYTLLKPTATFEDIYSLCEKAEEKGCASVCIPSYFVSNMGVYFPDLTICTVIGFPFGNSTLETKVAEAKKAIEDGADEIDMVINISELKDSNYKYIKREIDTIREVTKGHILKVIIETCYLTNTEIENVVGLIQMTGADYVKTSTGYGTRGASFEDIAIMKSVIHSDLKIKASGGIRTREEIEKYLELGCDRIGASKLPE